MRTNRTLEAVKKEQYRSTSGRIEMMEIYEVAVGCFQPLYPCIVDALAPEEFSP